MPNETTLAEDFLSSCLTLISTNVKTTRHLSSGFQISLGIDKPFSFSVGDLEISNTWGYIVNQKVPHQCNASDTSILVFFVDCTSSWGLVLRNVLLEKEFIFINSIVSVESILSIFPKNHEELSDECIKECLRRFITPILFSLPVPDQIKVDDRIKVALGYIEKNIINKIALADVAEVIHLSPYRTSHLFLEKLNISFTYILLWKRVHKVAGDVKKYGTTPLSSCMENGFADYSHFTKVFRHIFGAGPSSLFKQSRIIL